MKVKKILVTYLNNGNLESQVTSATMFNKVVQDLVDEGRVVKTTTSNDSQQKVVFEDDSTVILIPFGLGLRLGRITHAYIDHSLTNLPNGLQSIQRVIFPMLMIGDYSKFDTSGIQFSVYKQEDGKLEIT